MVPFQLRRALSLVVAAAALLLDAATSASTLTTLGEFRRVHDSVDLEARGGAADTGGGGHPTPPRPTPMNIAILAGGSRGDVQPYVALGIALRDAGHDVRILTNEDHAPFVRSFGLAHAAVYGSADALLRDDPDVRRAMAEGDSAAFFGAMAKYSKRNEAFCEPFYRELRRIRPDLLVSAGVAGDYAQFAQYSLGVPVVQAPLQTVIRRRRAPLGMAPRPLGLHERGVRKLLLRSLAGTKGPALAALTSSVPVPDVFPKERLLAGVYRPELPVFVCQSPVYRGALHSRLLHRNYRFVGPCVIESNQEETCPSHFGGVEARGRIEQFLRADPGNVPIYCGWGSMICKSSEHMTKLVVQALRLGGHRGIVLGGWAGMDAEALRRSTDDKELLSYAERNVLFVDTAPHEWLFRRVACTVHHGGMGTVTAALRAGVPTVVAPVYLDQFDSAALVNKLGAGVGLLKPLQKTTASELSSAIRRAVSSPHIKKKARELGVQLREENGAKTLAGEIEGFWETYVQTGYLDEKIKADLAKAGYRREGDKIVPII